LGSGGTAPAVVVGLAELGAQDISVVARSRDKAEPLLALGPRLGVDIRWIELGTTLADVDAVVSTIPADVAAGYAATVAATPLLLDAIYHPWPTPLAAAVEAAGGRVISGLQMLLHQAFAQVEQFTGLPAPTEAMRAALAEQ
jgi:shikimate dehydrogenase